MGRILVIAHRPLLRDVLHRALGALRHEPLATCDAMLGLELALTARPDVVVVEHDGPVLDGAGVVRELHEVLRDECPRVLLISSAAPEGEHPVTWLGPRPAVLVRKPYRASDLWEAVCRILPPTDAPPAHAAADPGPPLHADGPSGRARAPLTRAA